LHLSLLCHPVKTGIHEPVNVTNAAWIPAFAGMTKEKPIGAGKRAAQIWIGCKERIVTPGFKTEQEKFWAGDFGDQYINRNQGAEVEASNLGFTSRMLRYTQSIGSVIEFGANIGLNLKALKALLPNVELSAIEINQKAAAELEKIAGVKVYPQSILDFKPDFPRDMVLIKGVLIHIDPHSLPEVYERMYRSSSRYICLAEYYNPAPVEVLYRGNSGRLFKRDFAGEMLDRYPDLRLVDYGFAYHRDMHCPQDDLTWFLLEKTGK
jgi:pseudaminic acid biosynthesis-associated methylase